MRSISYFALLFIALFLSGCATQMEPPIDHPVYKVKSWHLRKINLSEKKRWNIQGSVSVTSNGKTQIGTFNWKQFDGRYAINIYGPLNLGSIGIAGQPGQVTLYKATGAHRAATPEALMAQQLGWYLPISNMFYWVKGLPAPLQTGKQVRDNYGHLILLQQQGWVIRFQSYESQKGADLPRKILMDNQKLHVKLVITHWNLD
jgi:outer membrane lipoprotein LolB